MVKWGRFISVLVEILIWAAVIWFASWVISGYLTAWCDGAQAGTAAKSAFLDGEVPVEAPSLPGSHFYTHGSPSTVAYSPGRYLTVACGAGVIRISFKTGEAEFINCNPSDASKSLWTGLKPFFNDCRR